MPERAQASVLFTGDRVVAGRTVWTVFLDVPGLPRDDAVRHGLGMREVFDELEEAGWVRTELVPTIVVHPSLKPKRGEEAAGAGFVFELRRRRAWLVGDR